MIAALVCGRIDEQAFGGRNTFPLLGRPMMVYPLLAATHAEEVESVYVSTDSEQIARVAEYQGVEVLRRSAELSGANALLEDVIADSIERIEASSGKELEYLVVLLCNAPTVSSELISHGLNLVRAEKDVDAVLSVSKRNEYSPRFAMQLGESNALEFHGSVQRSEVSEDAYFADSLLWVLRVESYTERVRASVPKNSVVNCETQKVRPLIHDGYGDVDYPWQVPAIEQWLISRGFTTENTPYGESASTGAVGRKNDGRVLKGEFPSHFSSKTKDRVLITTIPFGSYSDKPLKLLEENEVEYVINPIGRKLKEQELAELAKDFSVIIAGTEPNSRLVMDAAPHLRLISRVGVGLDSVDLLHAREKGIEVSYTPEAPAAAVAELAVGLMLSLLRYIPESSLGMKNGVWHRYMGSRLARAKVGILGTGRIGRRVIQHLQGFACEVLANDIYIDRGFYEHFGVRHVSREELLQESDIVSVHLPLTPQTKNLISEDELNLMKSTAVVINTARGGIVNEKALARALERGVIAGAAIDVFEQEPYSGVLANTQRCITTCHMGSMSSDCRSRMELEATEEVIRFLRGEELQQRVPEYEYALAEMANVAPEIRQDVAQRK